MKILIKNVLMLPEVTGESDKNSLSERYCLATDSDRISYIGRTPPKGENGEGCEYDRVIDGGGGLLLAGLYNSHCHSPMTLFRGYGEDLPLDRWLKERIFPAEDLLTPESVRAASALAIAEMIKNGIISFTDMYSLCEQTADMVIESGIKANIGRAILSFDPYEDISKNERFLEAKSLAENYHNLADGRLLIDMAIHAEYTNTAKSCAFVAEYAKSNGYNIQLHLSETEKEHKECIMRHGRTPAEFFLDLGVFDTPVCAAHCVWLSDGDVEILAKHNATAVHNPTSNLKLGSGVMPLSKMLDYGVNLAIGTDGTASNNTLDILKELHLAAILHKGVNRKADIITANEIWQLAAKGGAISQGRSECGMLEVGKKADIILLDLDAVNNIPVYDLYATVAHSAAAADIKLTMADGKVLYENGEYKTLDIEKIKHDFRKVLIRYFNDC